MNDFSRLVFLFFIIAEKSLVQRQINYGMATHNLNYSKIAANLWKRPALQTASQKIDRGPYLHTKEYIPYQWYPTYAGSLDIEGHYTLKYIGH